MKVQAGFDYATNLDKAVDAEVHYLLGRWLCYGRRGFLKGC